MELLCPAGNLPALKVAVDNGVDAVYIGFRDDTNARHFAGLNFNEKNWLKPSNTFMIIIVNYILLSIRLLTPMALIAGYPPLIWLRKSVLMN